MDREEILKEYNDKAKFYSKELWNIEYDGEVVFNNRLRSSDGRFLSEDNIIEFNKALLTLNCKDYIDEVLLHELCHWYCYVSELEWDDGDFDFEEQIYLSGSRPTETSCIKSNMIMIIDDEAWYYCKNCDNSKEVHKFKRNELIRHYGEHREKCRPECPICNGKLSYSHEANREERVVPFFMRDKLSELIDKYEVSMKII